MNYDFDFSSYYRCVDIFSCGQCLLKSYDCDWNEKLSVTVTYHDALAEGSNYQIFPYHNYLVYHDHQQSYGFYFDQTDQLDLPAILLLLSLGREQVGGLYFDFDFCEWEIDLNGFCQ